MRKEDLARAALGRRSGFLSTNVRQDRPCLSAEGYFGFFLFPFSFFLFPFSFGSAIVLLQRGRGPAGEVNRDVRVYWEILMV